MHSSQDFGKLKSEILRLLSVAEFDLEEAHAKDTLAWVKKIDLSASEPLQIAALAHDIERAVKPMVKRKAGEAHPSYKRRHAQRSARILAELMAKHGYKDEFIKRTCSLVEMHEVGGSREADILRDADSISFFSCNIEWYYKYKDKNLDVVRHQVQYKYSRASSRAKELIKTIKIKNKILSNVCQGIFAKKGR